MSESTMVAVSFSLLVAVLLGVSISMTWASHLAELERTKRIEAVCKSAEEITDKITEVFR